jgi:hypothetical protein
MAAGLKRNTIGTRGTKLTRILPLDLVWMIFRGKRGPKNIRWSRRRKRRYLTSASTQALNRPKRSIFPLTRIITISSRSSFTRMKTIFSNNQLLRISIQCSDLTLVHPKGAMILPGTSNSNNSSTISRHQQVQASVSITRPQAAEPVISTEWAINNSNSSPLTLATLARLPSTSPLRSMSTLDRWIIWHISQRCQVNSHRSRTFLLVSSKIS